METKRSEWLESIHQSLSSLHDDNVQSQLFSIYSVPESLKKCNWDAYMPRVVSIGPRFISREDLLPMEEVKLRCIVSLLYRASRDPTECLEACGEAIRKSVEVVRASYAPDMVEVGKLSDLQLAKIMLVDGCFLLELLISKGLDSDLPSHLFPPGPAAELINNDDVLSDLMLFENQIPIFVLYELFQTLFSTTQRREWSERKINAVVFSLFGYPNPPTELDKYLPKVTHILDLVRVAVNRRILFLLHYNRRIVEALLSVDQTRRRQQQQQQQRPKLNRCALRLLTAGVTILPEGKDSTGFGALSWLSDIFVVNGGRHMDHIPEAKDDVQFLKDKKVIVDHMNMSNQELMEFFRKIALGFDYRAVVDCVNYTRMVDEINNFSKAFVIKRIWSTVWNSFTYRQEWLLRFLNRNYNFVATVISLCTVVQTIYAIIAYQLPKN